MAQIIRPRCRCGCHCDAIPFEPTARAHQVHIGVEEKVRGRIMNFSVFSGVEIVSCPKCDLACARLEFGTLPRFAIKARNPIAHG